MFWVISVYFNIRNTLPKSGTFLLGHRVYCNVKNLNVLMYICCALVGTVEDSVSQNAWCSSEKKMKIKVGLVLSDLLKGM